MKKLKGVTAFLFVTTQLAAIIWVSVSYILAAYATVKLGQPYPVVELSQQAITSLLGVGILKVVENVFEHNNGGIFGISQKEESDDDSEIDEP